MGKEDPFCGGQDAEVTQINLKRRIGHEVEATEKQDCPDPGRHHDGFQSWGGGTALGAAVTEAADLNGALGQDYKLVTLELDQGEFKNTLKYETQKSSPSDSDEFTASDSNSGVMVGRSLAAEDDEDENQESDNTEIDLVNDLAGETGMLTRGASGKETTFAVTDGDDLAYDTVEEILGDGFANIQYTGDKPSEIVWLTRKGDLTSRVDWEEPLPLTDDTTRLYAASFMGASGSSQQVEVTGVSAAGVPSGDSLVVGDLAPAQKRPEDELKRIAGAAYANLDAAGALQLDMHLSSDEEPAAPVTVRVELPESFAVAKDRSVVLIHDGRRGPEVVESEDIWEEEDSVRRVQFTLRDFSPVYIALSDKLVSVKLENVTDGFGLIYSRTADDISLSPTEDEVYTCLPIGEEVQVPAGTNLILREYGFRDTEFEGYKITVDGEPREPEDSAGTEYFTIEESMNRVVFTPVFTHIDPSGGNEDGLFSHSKIHEAEKEWITPRAVETTLEYLGYDAESDVYRKQPATGWYLSRTEYDDGSGRKTVDGLFTLDADTGVLTSTGVLDLGTYTLTLRCRHDGERVDGTLRLNIGVSADFMIHFGHYDDIHGREARWNCLVDEDYDGDKFRYGSNAFGMFRQAAIGDRTPVAMYGGYEFAGWYDEGPEQKLNDDTMVRKQSLYANAWFKKEDTWYDPLIHVTGGSGDLDDPDNPNTPDNPDTPNNPDDPSNPGNPTGSGNPAFNPDIRRPSDSGDSDSGSSSYSNSQADTIFGAWQQDSQGWKFQLTNGSYAANQWGRVNGAWYYFGADTYMETGWLDLNGTWYYLNPAAGARQGQMQTGWIFDQTCNRWFYLEGSGRMLTGWQQIGGVWYYLNPIADGTGGAMLAGQWVDDYYVNENGAWVPGMTR